MLPLGVPILIAMVDLLHDRLQLIKSNQPSSIKPSMRFCILAHLRSGTYSDIADYYNDSNSDASHLA